VDGTPTTGTATIALTNQQVIVRGPSFAGNLFDVNAGESLTITSGIISDSSSNIDINVNGGTFTITPASGLPFEIDGIIYLASGSVINIGASLTSINGNLNVQIPTTPTGWTTVAVGATSTISSLSQAKVVSTQSYSKRVITINIQFNVT